MIDNPSIGGLFAQYDHVLKELSLGMVAERAANQRVIDARERLSNLQKAIDNLIETRRDNPPLNTHWHDKKGEPYEAR